jgi:hypothetical protein
LTDTNPNNHEQLSNIERKTDTMKTYILRDTKPVEPQKSIRSPRPKPVAPMTAAALPRRPDATAKSAVLFIGLDVHNDSIAVSLAPPEGCSRMASRAIRVLAMVSIWFRPVFCVLTVNVELNRSTSVQVRFAQSPNRSPV